MRIDNLQQYVRLRRELTSEKESLVARLKQINEALGEAPLPSLSPVQGATGLGESQVRTPGRRGRRPAGGGQSLREHVLEVLQGGPMTKEEVLEAVQRRGYKFSTGNPLNSLGVILYGKNPKFNRVDGRFSIGNGATTTTAPSARGGRRQMSAAGKARIAAAQRARWAKQKGSAAPAPSAKPARKGGMSAVGRAAIAEAARKRWAAAKRARKNRL